jgi:hypothetical protein
MILSLILGLWVWFDFTAPDYEFVGEEASLAVIIADPLERDGETVRTYGFLNFEFEGNALYLHEEDFLQALSRNAIWVSRPDFLDDRSAGEVSQKYVMIEGTFDADDQGHLGAYSGTLSNVTRIAYWPSRSDFVAAHVHWHGRGLALRFFAGFALIVFLTLGGVRLWLGPRSG